MSTEIPKDCDAEIWREIGLEEARWLLKNTKAELQWVYSTCTDWPDLRKHGPTGGLGETNNRLSYYRFRVKVGTDGY